MSIEECHKMFCFQCEETAKGTGCTVRGVCLKDADVAVLQDYLIETVQDVGAAVTTAVKAGQEIPRDVQVYVFESFFATLTNVNFDGNKIFGMIQQGAQLVQEYADNGKKYPATKEEAVVEGRKIGIPAVRKVLGETRANLVQMALIGMKGLCAYAFHAYVLGCDTLYAVFTRVCEILGCELRVADPSVAHLVGVSLEIGDLNVKVMAGLHACNTGRFGNPEPSEVHWIHKAEEGSVKPGKAILCSGHDFHLLDQLLKHAEPRGVQVYTHGEMLAAHGYPYFKGRLGGHFGTAWQNQKTEFPDFPGPVVVTTNCYIPPPESYAAKMYTCPPVAAAHTKQILNCEFAEVVDKALEMDGFADAKGGKKITVGFGLNTIVSVKDKLIEAIEKKLVNHIYVIGGCDGHEKIREQYTLFAKALPTDSIILTCGCGKFKLNEEDFGTVAGLPRLLDMGQCNDSYVGVVVALELAKHFNCTLNDLPLTFVLSWYEQKAVAVLLSLLYLNVKKINVGPKLPGFFDKPILDLLVKEYEIALFNDAAALLERLNIAH